MKLAISIWQYFTAIVVRPLLLLFAGLKIDGTHFLEVVNGPVIFISNHRNEFDPWLLATSVPFKFHKIVLPFRFATHARFMENPFLKPILKLWGCYPIAPGSGSLEQVLDSALKITKDREQSMVFFPEGKLVKKGEPSKARPGIAYLAKTSKWLIMPVGLTGVEDLSFLKFITFQNKLTVRFGQPFYYHEIANEGEDLIAVSEKMMQRVNKLVNGVKVTSQDLSFARGGR